MNLLDVVHKSGSNDMTLSAALAAFCHALDAEPRLGLFVGDRGWGAATCCRSNALAGGSRPAGVRPLALAPSALCMAAAWLCLRVRSLPNHSLRLATKYLQVEVL